MLISGFDFQVNRNTVVLSAKQRHQCCGRSFVVNQMLQRHHKQTHRYAIRSKPETYFISAVAQNRFKYKGNRKFFRN